MLGQIPKGQNWVPCFIRVLRFGGGSLSGGVLGPLGAQLPWNDSSRVRGGPWPPRIENSLQKFCSVNCLWLLSSPFRWLVFWESWDVLRRNSFCLVIVPLRFRPILFSSCVLCPLPLRETDQANRCTRFTHPPFAGSSVLSCFAPARFFFSVFCFFSFVLFGFSAGPFWVFFSAPCGFFGVFGGNAFWGGFLFVPPVRVFCSRFFCFFVLFGLTPQQAGSTKKSRFSWEFWCFLACHLCVLLVFCFDFRCFCLFPQEN